MGQTKEALVMGRFGRFCCNHQTTLSGIGC
jgi:hypothetical protein